MGNTVGNIMGGLNGASGGLLDPLDMWKKNDPNAGQKYMAKPEDAKFVGLTNEDGSLADRFKLSDGLEYSNIAKQKLEQEKTAARDSAARANFQNAASARNSISGRGGLSGGMAALLERNAMNNNMNSQQAITQAGIEADLGIQNKQFDIGREAEASNVGALRGNQAALNEFTQNKYAADMGAWGANNTANSQLAVANKPKTGLAKLTGK